MATPTTSKRLVLVLGFIFIIPMLASTLLFMRGKPFGHPTNKGVLIHPPISFTPEGSTSHQWTLLLLVPSRCDSQCHNWLHQMKQIHTATGKYQNHVQRLALSLQPLSKEERLALQKQYPGLEVKVSAEHELAQKLHLAVSQPIDLQQSSVYLIDPKGYVMMGYKPDANPTDVLKDLKHIIRVT